MQGGLAATFLSFAVIAAPLLFGGGIVLIRRGDRRKGVLMLVASIVLLGNVLVLTWPA
jgi:hypothetical protein